MKDRILLLIPKPGFLTYSLMFIQLCYYMVFIIHGVPGYSLSPADCFSMLLGFISLFLIASVLEILISTKITALVITPVILLAACGLYAYHLTAASPLDYSLVRDNIGISFSSEAFQMLSTPFSLTDVMFLLIIAGVSLLLEIKFSLISRSTKLNLGRRFAALFLWLAIIFIPVNAGDEFTLFAKSIRSSNVTASAATDTGGYPYDKDTVSTTSTGKSLAGVKNGKPNVILILIESFNANFVETKAPDGIDYTPEFNSLINTGLYIERFYGNSIQTCKGQAATFFSILPSINGKLFVDYADLNVAGFPSLLRDSGYNTIFFQAFHNLKFDNTAMNMEKAGFSVVKSYAEFRRKEDRPYIWGWGVEDKIFYERFFEFLDAQHRKTPDKPVFAALATVGTHIPCDGLPVEKRTIYKDPKNIREKYSNALRLSDSQLPRFFELLKQRKYLDNTIVMITSDHSFPMKEHNLYNNEICFYDEAFRIPFLVIWDGVIKPERVKGNVYSQIDIGPTITDLAGITKGRNNMTGISIFDRMSEHPVYLIQPYNGKFLQVVKYPLKFITHLKTGKEYLFNLEADPSEKTNLLDKGADLTITAELRELLSAVYLNQKLIEENRIRKP